MKAHPHPDDPEHWGQPWSNWATSTTEMLKREAQLYADRFSGSDPMNSPMRFADTDRPRMYRVMVENGLRRLREIARQIRAEGLD